MPVSWYDNQALSTYRLMIMILPCKENHDSTTLYGMQKSVRAHTYQISAAMETLTPSAARAASLVILCSPGRNWSPYRINKKGQHQFFHLPRHAAWRVSQSLRSTEDCMLHQLVIVLGNRQWSVLEHQPLDKFHITMSLLCLGEGRSNNFAFLCAAAVSSNRQQCW